MTSPTHSSSAGRRTDLHFPDKDTPLREDVHLMGALVGAVIREQGGEELFERVEAARRSAIRRREAEGAGDGEAQATAAVELCAVVDDLDAPHAEALVRSFSTYFQVVNLAEKVHRIRRRRDYLRREDEAEPQPESLRHTLELLRDGGLSRSATLSLLGRVRVEPVFTAHPTEATRRTILEKHQRIARRLVERLDPSRTPPEERTALARIRNEVTTAWQTDEHPEERPTVLDEARHMLFYVTDVLYRVLPPFYEELEAALEGVWNEPLSPEERQRLPRPIHFGSWIGADMDGNPNVTAETLEATLDLHRRLVLDLHRQQVQGLAAELSQSTSRIGVDDAVRDRIDAYAALFPRTFRAVPPRHREMPYRVLLTLMARRLEAGDGGEDGGYRGVESYLEDLRRVESSLEAHQGDHAGRFAVRRAVRRAETFGFHLVTLDVRQDAGVHRRVLGRLLGEENWEDRPAAERAARLRRALVEDEEPQCSPDEESEATLEVFRAIGRARHHHGPRAVGPFILSMARDADDVLGTLLLGRWGGLAAGQGQVPLDVAPLFETVADLEAAPGVMRWLAHDELYRDHLEARQGRQLVMLGYSDSNKDGGLAASRWALHRAQESLVAALAQSGVHLGFFHGRGGTVSRGGGRIHRAVAAAPRGAVSGLLRMTEQGEVIDQQYGLRGIALRTLERAVGATTLATARELAPEDETAPAVEWREAMEEVAAASREAYRALVYEEPDFPVYFRHATPIDVLEHMRIGSRPARRQGEGGTMERLRAIPWVFAWTQSRHLLPGWYGLGTGLERAVKEHGEGLLKAMVDDWPFFRNLLDDAEMVLAKSDFGIARRYARLAGAAGERLFPRLERERDRTVAWILELQGREDLLEDEPTLQRSIRLRNPYVDPMSLLQVDLLRRWRAGNRQDPALLDALLTTVHGIAQGLQNTG